MKTYITPTDAGDFEIRVGLDEGRHGGKLIATCPTERVVECVQNALEWADGESVARQEKGYWDWVFEVTDECLVGEHRGRV